MLLQLPGSLVAQRQWTRSMTSAWHLRNWRGLCSTSRSALGLRAVRQRSLDGVPLQGDDLGEAEASKLIEKYEPYRKGVLETGVVAGGEP